ncbi:hypothetical protein ACFLQU_01960 [Verrucomicrobiota bacterium]
MKTRSKTNQEARARKSGFSLMEVCLALMIMSVGIATIFGLFPGWVKEIDFSVADAHAGLFAEYVLSGMQANAAAIDDWAVWSDDTAFQDAVLLDLGVFPTAGNSTDTIEYPAGSGHDLKYVLELGTVDSATGLRSVLFGVSYGERGWEPNLFHSEFFFNNPE